MHTMTNSRIPILHNLFYTHSISISFVCCTSDCFLHETNHVNINDNAVAVCLVLFWNACNCLYRFPHHLQKAPLCPRTSVLLPLIKSLVHDALSASKMCVVTQIGLSFPPISHAQCFLPISDITMSHLSLPPSLISSPPSSHPLLFVQLFHPPSALLSFFLSVRTCFVLACLPPLLPASLLHLRLSPISITPSTATSTHRTSFETSPCRSMRNQCISLNLLCLFVPHRHHHRHSLSRSLACCCCCCLVCSRLLPNSVFFIAFLERQSQNRQTKNQKQKTHQQKNQRNNHHLRPSTENTGTYNGKP